MALLITWLALASALAQQAAPLFNLSAGTTLTTTAPIRLRANNVREPIARSATTGLQCFAEAKHAESFDRVIPVGASLRVVEVARRALSSRGVSSNWTYLFVASEALDRITCSSARNAPDPTIAEFRSTVTGALKVAEPKTAVEVR
jgi:hypothetical protein